MKKNLIKGTGIVSFGVVAIGILATNWLPVFAQSSSAPTKQTKQAISSLPNGNYFYGSSRLPYKSGGDYVIFRKTGGTITGMKYPVPGEPTCFKGTASRTTITNVTVQYVPLGESNAQGNFVPRNPLNLSSYYKLKFDQAPNFAKKGLQGCVQVFANKK
ncbi:hypothetical protein H6F77_04450 [Microcoleus sp. FACHB-831]|uniref:hypothetical protein n=1 Tax=Microcoleus sp. FACHB-831 TaxID=2692827 RepID=UPI0016822DED|nr:hypothetical protein [Microcoleus sp. FACHB-831]MBD1920369.1 hypothetical protein [Microcoleus sp. FACHB-831]